MMLTLCIVALKLSRYYQDVAHRPTLTTGKVNEKEKAKLFLAHSKERIQKKRK